MFKDCKSGREIKYKNEWTRAKTRKHDREGWKISEERREPKKGGTK